MLRVIAVEEPSPVVEFFVGAHSPRNRLVGVAAVMPIVTVQIREALAKVPKRQKKTDVTPVENAQDNERCDERGQLEDSPKCFARIFPLQLLENGLRIFAKEAEEGVHEGMLRFAFVTMFINRNPINSFTCLIRAVCIAFVMLHVNAFVKNLAKPDRDRLHDAKQTIEQRRTEVRVVNEVVRYSVDVPGNADRINKSEDEHHPKGDARKKIKHAEEVGAVTKGGRDWDRVPACVRKDPGVRPGAFDIYELA